MTTENIELIVSGKDDNATGVLKDVQRESSGLGKILKGGLAVGAVAAAAGIGAMVVGLGSSVKEAMAAEEAQAQLNATIKSTKGVAGMTSKALNEQALALSKVTRFEDDAIIASDALMLTFTNIGKDTFPQATKATLDLATKFKMDLQSATVMVGKALNDPIKGLTAMGRAGVQFTEKQKDMIKAMVEVGDVAGAQKIILKELELQVGGSAEAAGKTAAGQMDIFKNSLGNIKEEIGGALIPVMQSLIGWLGPKLTSGLQAFSDWFRGSLGDIEQFAGKLGKAKDIIGGMITDIQAGKKINWQDLMNLSGLFTNQLDVQRKFATIVTDIQTGLGQIKTAFETGGIGAAAGVVWDMFTGAISKAVDSIDWEVIRAKLWLAWNSFSSGLKFEAEKLLIAVKAIDWEGLKATLGTWLSEVEIRLTTIFASLGAWIELNAPMIGASLTKALKGIITINGQMLGSDANLAYTLGAGFVKLLVASLKALSIGPQLLLAALKSAFESGLGEDANWGEIFGNIFGPIGDFLMGAFDALLTELLGTATAKVEAWWKAIWAAITFGMPSGSGSNSGNGSGAGNNSRSMDGNSGGRGMYGGMAPITIHVHAAGGNADVVRRAANQGTLEALRARGYR